MYLKFRYFILSPILLGLTMMVFVSNSGGTAFVGNGDSTGSPGSSNTCWNCHTGGSFEPGIALTVKDELGYVVTSYIPNTSYFLEYVVSANLGSPSFGFQSVVLSASNSNAGLFDSVLTTNTQISGSLGRILVEHISPSSTGVFIVRWIAPPAGTGNVTIYFMGNAVNLNNSNTGDEATNTYSVNLTEQIVFSANISQVNSIMCNGDSTASLEATVANGTPPYNYSWSNGVNSGVTTNISHTIGGLHAGNYSVTIIDGNANVVSSSIVVSEPDSLNVSFSANEPRCFTATNGNISSLVIGGVSPYQYLWNTGDSTFQINNLDTGLYILSVQDSLGCSLSDSVLLNSPNIVPLVDMGDDTVLCDQGLWSITFDAGTLTDYYDYLWSTSDTTYSISVSEVGAYWLAVTDSLNCTGRDTAYIDFGCSIFNSRKTKVGSISVYPNPAQTSIAVKTSLNGILKIYTNDGALKYKELKNQPILSIDISNYTSGVYFITLDTKDGVITQRIIINSGK